jgi:hypothetical protein
MLMLFEILPEETSIGVRWKKLREEGLNERLVLTDREWKSIC